MNALHAPNTGPKINTQIEARLNEYIEAHQGDLEHSSKLVSENPAHAVRTLMLRDMQLFVVNMKRVVERLPQATALYEAQSPAIRAKIDTDVAHNLTISIAVSW